MSELRARMKADLVAAMKRRDSDTVATLRSALAAIDNAEAVPAEAANPTTSEHVAGAGVGVGSTERERRHLTDDAVRDVLAAEIAELRRVAATYVDVGFVDQADQLRAEADLLSGY